MENLKNLLMLKSLSEFETRDSLSCQFYSKNSLSFLSLIIFTSLGGSVGCASESLVIRSLQVRLPIGSATFFRGDLIIKYFLWSFSPFR